MKTETLVGIFVVSAVLIFLYMTFFLGIFRLDRWQYTPYLIYFNDVSGLERKAEVKIAGVKVGWVEAIELISNDPHQVKAQLRVHKKYTLFNNAYGLVRQDGLLGTKYLELFPGDSLLPVLSPGKALDKPGRPAASVDEILFKVKEIADNVEDVTHSLQASFGGRYGKEQVQSMFDNLQMTIERFAAFSNVLDRTISSNEERLNTMIVDFKEVAHSMKEAFPSIQDSVSRVANRLDKDVGKVADKLESSISILEEAVIQARDGFKSLSSITEKIDEGKGVVGKLINEDETYRDIKVTVQGLKNYFSKVDALSIVFDSHGEYMYRPAEHVNFEDAKGYLEARIHPNDDHFYVLQYVAAQKGNIHRSIREVKWFDERCNEILPSQFVNQTDKAVFLPELVGTIETRERVLDKTKYGAQIGKVYKNLALRVGIFENSAGFGVDFDIPFNTDKFRWVTTLEGFDFRGRDRFSDKRPHFKWLNRVFLLRNLYVAFGADDFVSKENANGFFGGGLRFCDDDVKYFLAQAGLAGLAG
jgi:phospholipid/cholesterol/gamma-HCH transport system substrate-binding protein